MVTLRKLVLILAILGVSGVCLAACGASEAANPTPAPTNTPTLQPSPTSTKEPTFTPTATNTPTPLPTDTPTPTQTHTATPTPEPTATPTQLAPSPDDVILVKDGNFSFWAVPGFLTDVRGSQAGIFSADDEILLFMIANPADTENTLEEILANFVEAAGADMDELIAGEPYPYLIDDKAGLAVDVTGALFGDDLEGRIAVVSPDETRIFVAFGFAVNDRWEDEGSEMFEAVLQSVSFSTDDAATDSTDIQANPDFLLPLPTEKPASEWNGIPIMPQAIAGEGDSKSYAFTVEATAVEVQSFYEKELGKLGWSLLGAGEGDTGVVLLIFQKGTEVASVSILTVNPSTLYVFLVK